MHGIDVKQNHLQKGHWNEVPTWDWAVDVVLKCIMGPFWGTNFDPVSYTASSKQSHSAMGRNNGPVPRATFKDRI